MVLVGGEMLPGTFLGPLESSFRTLENAQVISDTVPV